MFQEPGHITKQISSGLVCYRMEMIEAARNKVRVKVCYLMILVTIMGCLVMAVLGKQVGQRTSGHDGMTVYVYVQVYMCVLCHRLQQDMSP